MPQILADRFLKCRRRDVPPTIGPPEARSETSAHETIVAFVRGQNYADIVEK